MSERYIRLFSLSENIYAEGSPAVISAGALLKDNQTGKVLVQLKIKNIGVAVIKAAKVAVQPLDTVGAKLGGEVGYTYLDFSVRRDEEFGQKTLIPLPDKESRGFEVRLMEAVFTDNAVWKDNGKAWESLPVPESIDTIGDAELVKQYRIKFGTDSTVCPMQVKDLWYCNCGALNRKNESCHICGKDFVVIKAVDIESLKAERDVRLQKERQEAEATEKEAKKKKKRIVSVAAPIVTVCVLLFVVLTTIIIPNKEKAELYQNAVSMYETEQYAEARALFEKLGDYKDSRDYLEKAYSPMEKLCRYIEENGEDFDTHLLHNFAITSVGAMKTIPAPYNNNDASIYLCVKGNSLFFVYDFTVGNYLFTCEIEEGETDVTFDGYTFIDGIPKTAGEVFEVSADVDISTYKKGDVFKPSYCSDRKIPDWENTFGVFLSHCFEMVPGMCEVVIKQSGLPITVADLGFTSY